MRSDLFDLFEMDELKKYYTGDELGGHRSDAPRGQRADQTEGGLGDEQQAQGQGT
jgi:succinate dehydrogenase / fumarate reductase flavoprotein subunit